MAIILRSVFGCDMETVVLAATVGYAQRDFDTIQKQQEKSLKKRLIAKISKNKK